MSVPKSTEQGDVRRVEQEQGDESCKWCGHRHENVPADLCEAARKEYDRATRFIAELECHPTNADRAEWARGALDRFGELTGETIEADGAETLVVDLLADLRHFADRFCEAGWSDLTDSAERHYRVEVNEEHEAIESFRAYGQGGEEIERCSECGANLAESEGEGYDGLCGDCADRAEAKGRWS